MGLFTTKKKIYVASTVYNMAGEFALRPNYLKTTVARGVLTNSPSLGEEIIDGQFNGPNIDQRLFFRWSRNNFPEGTISGSLSSRQILTAPQQALASSIITVDPGESLQIVYAFIDYADISYFAERHILENWPDQYNTDWVCDWDTQNDQMKITYDGGNEELVTVPDYQRDKDYLYIFYNTLIDEVIQAWTPDPLETDLPVRPDTASDTPAWVQDSYTETIVTETLQDGPGITRDEDVTDSVEVLTRTINLGKQGNAIQDENQRLTIWKQHRIISTGPDTEEIEVYWESQLERQEIIRQDTGNRAIHIYEMGSGNVVLDALQQVEGNLTEFFPIIPIRIENKGIDHEDYASIFPNCKKAYKRSIGRKISDILGEIESNEHIDDIDHCFLTFGVEVNTLHKEGMRYLYEFFSALIPYQITDENDLMNWASQQTFADYQNDLNDWYNDQLIPGSPRYGEPRPVHVSYPMPDMSSIRMKSTYGGPLTIPYDVAIEWAAIGESTHAGQGKVDAEVNEIWWEVMPDIVDPNFVPLQLGDEGGSQVANFWRDEGFDLTHARLYWQVDENSYKVLDIYGMKHINRVYKGKSVDISLTEGIEDVDESGFVVPLHYYTLKKLPLVWANELAVSNRILVFNSYEVVKQRWWQRGIFRIIFSIIIAVIIALVFPGGIGLLGSHLTVGTAFGFTGTAALVAGAVANAIAAIIMTQALNFASVALFGEEWGALIGAIASFLIGHMAMNFHTTGNFAINWGIMMRADNLLAITGAISRGVHGFAAGRIRGIQEEMETLQEEYEEDMREIMERFLDLGYSGVVIDPLIFTEQGSSGDRGRSFESSETFLRRTLLTGSDIAEMTMSMIEEFPELSLTLPEAIE